MKIENYIEEITKSPPSTAGLLEELMVSRV